MNSVNTPVKTLIVAPTILVTTFFAFFFAYVGAETNRPAFSLMGLVFALMTIPLVATLLVDQVLRAKDAGPFDQHDDPSHEQAWTISGRLAAVQGANWTDHEGAAYNTLDALINEAAGLHPKMAGGFLRSDPGGRENTSNLRGGSPT